MLKLVIPPSEIYNEETNEFTEIKGATLQLEHSLVSLSRWESITHKPFLQDRPPKTKEEIDLYIQCMTVTQNVDPEVYKCLTDKDREKVLKYIDDPMTATWFNEDKTRKGVGRSNELITSEYLYYMMVDMNIPPEYQKWHLNRLLTLIRIIALKSKGNKKMPKGDIGNQYAAMKAARRMRK